MTAIYVKDHINFDQVKDLLVKNGLKPSVLKYLGSDDWHAYKLFISYKQGPTDTQIRNLLTANGYSLHPNLYFSIGIVGYEPKCILKRSRY